MADINSLEKKLDRYYDDLMSKILEIIETQQNILGEQKDLKKDVAKLKEHVLESKLELGHIITKLNSKSNAGSDSVPKNESAPSSSEETTKTPKTVKKASAPAANLKEFLAEQVSIFDVKVLNAFIKATKEILKSNTRQEVPFLKPIIEDKITLDIVVAGKMQLSRDKGSGAMALCMEKDSAIAITKAVFMMPEDGNVTDADIKDVTSEICNQICGKSKLTLKSEGYSFEIGIPEIHQGTPAELLKTLGHPKVVLYFEFAKNPFYISFWG